MNIKMIVTDMDGTLLNSNDELQAKTCQALIAAQEKGIRIVLASGRSYMKLLSFAKRLQMDQYGGYLIEVNGMAVMEVKSQKREVFRQITHEECLTLFSVLAPFDVEQQYMIDDGVFHYLPEAILKKKKTYRKDQGYPDDYPLTASILGYIYDNRLGYPKITSIQDAKEINMPINKVCVYEEPAKLAIIAETLKTQLRDSFWTGLVKPNWLEITPLGVSKGDRLLKLARQLHIEPEEILCFGDGENDIEMLRSVPYGIAMGNALDSVKEAAYQVTESNDEDGIAQALKRFGVL